MPLTSFKKKCADSPRLRHLPRVAGATGALSGLLIIVSWHAHWRPVLQWLPNSAPMHYNVALCFILSGAGLFLLTTSRAKIAPWLGGAGVILPLLTLLEYVTGRDFGIDQFFFKSYFEVDRIYPGRMSVLAAVCFIFIGTGIALTGAKKRWSYRLTGAGLLAFIVTLIASVALFGYAFSVETATGWGAYARMTVNSSLTFLLLSSGLLVWAWQTARQENFNFLRWLPAIGSITLMAMIGVISAASLATLKNALFWRGNTYETLTVATSFIGSLADTQRGMRGYLLTASPAALELYRSATNSAPRQLAQLVKLAHDNPAQEQHLTVLTTDLDAVIAYSRQLIGMNDNQGLRAAIQLEKTGRGLSVMNSARADLTTFTQGEEQLLVERDGTVTEDFRNTARMLVFGSLLAGGLLVLANLIARREVKRRSRAEEFQRALNAQLGKTTALQNAILSSANYAIISTTVEGLVTTFNSTAERWLGYSAGEIIGKETPTLWHDANEVVARAKTLSDELGVTIKQGFGVLVAKSKLVLIDENEWTLIRKDGSRFPVSLSVTALMDDDREITGYLGVVADITERKRAEERLRESEERLRLIVEGVKDYAIVMLDPEGQVTSWNHGAERIQGYKAKEIIGQHFAKFFPAEALAACKPERELAEALAKGQIEDEGLRVRKDGSLLFANVIVTAIFDAQGRHRGFAKVTRDITERKAHEAEREKLIAELQAAVTEVKTLSGMIPICSWCKSVRTDEGYWESVEHYFHQHADAIFTHGMCPSCATKFKTDILMPDARVPG
jgi:PAS domain S-box-containing protein